MLLGVCSNIQFGLCEAAADEPVPSPQTGEGQIELQLQLLQIGTPGVVHRVLLEMPPEPSHRVEVRGAQAAAAPGELLASLRRQELLDIGSPVDRRPVPDHQQSLVGRFEEMTQERDTLRSAECPGSHEPVTRFPWGVMPAMTRQLAVASHSSASREAPPSILDLDRRPAGGRMSTHPRRRWSGSRAGPSLFKAGHDSSRQRSMAASSRWMARVTEVRGFHPNCLSRRDTWLAL